MATTRAAKDIRRFDRWSHTYDDSWLQERLFGPVHQTVLNLALDGPAPRTILDVGCGTGRLLSAALQRWPDARLIGVDPAEGMVAEASRQIPAARFMSAAAEALPLPDAAIDLAMSTMSFHHWRDHAAGLREIARVLRPDGRFILADGAPPAWLAPLLVRMGKFFSPAQRRGLFVAAGLIPHTPASVPLGHGAMFFASIGVTVGVRPSEAS
jgi:ubiquinone/menaquinone biosynthesis C-methylase UbiE